MGLDVPPNPLSSQAKKDTQWTDALVRWTAANHNLKDDDDDDDNDDDASDDSTPFQPNPSQLFSRSFPLTQNSTTIDVDLQGYEEQSDTIYISTGLTLWRSSELLCEYLIHPEGATRLEQLRTNCRQQQGQDHLQILELGSGLGLVGIFLQKLLLATTEPSNNNKKTNNKDVDCLVLTDGDTNALSLLRQNIQTNILRLPQSSSPTPRIKVEQLIWGRDTTESFLQQQQQQQQQPQDHLQHNQKFDLLLAADAIYVLANVKPLMESVETLLQKPDGQFWFSYCRRRQVSVQIQDVLSEATSIGLDYEQIVEDDDILIYIFRWASTTQRINDTITSNMNIVPSLESDKSI